MPMFEFECTRCRCSEDRLIRSQQDVPTNCQKCNGPLLRKLSKPAVAVKTKVYDVLGNASFVSRHEANGKVDSYFENDHKHMFDYESNGEHKHADHDHSHDDEGH